MEKLRESQASPVVVIGLAGAVILALLVGLYFAFLKPKQEADRALANFNSPEAQAKRDPDQRKIDPQLAKTIEQLKAKEQHLSTNPGIGRRQRDHN